MKQEECEVYYCPDDGQVTVAFGCLGMHVHTMWVCEACGENFREAAKGNLLKCAECDRLCAEFLIQWPDREPEGIAMGADPPELFLADCEHPVVTAGKCDTCGRPIPDPECGHKGLLAPVYGLGSSDPQYVMCQNCQGYLEPPAAFAVCDHTFVSEIDTSQGVTIMTAIRCSNCGLTPMQANTP